MTKEIVRQKLSELIKAKGAKFQADVFKGQPDSLFERVFHNQEKIKQNGSCDNNITGYKKAATMLDNRDIAIIDIKYIDADRTRIRFNIVEDYENHEYSHMAYLYYDGIQPTFYEPEGMGLVYTIAVGVCSAVSDDLIEIWGSERRDRVRKDREYIRFNYLGSDQQVLEYYYAMVFIPKLRRQFINEIMSNFPFGKTLINHMTNNTMDLKNLEVTHGTENTIHAKVCKWLFEVYGAKYAYQTVIIDNKTNEERIKYCTLKPMSGIQAMKVYTGIVEDFDKAVHEILGWD